jgi:hypothetical protein
MAKCLHQQTDAGIFSINRAYDATKLLAQTELFNQSAIAISVLALQIREQPLATVNHHDQAATGVVILGVGLEMGIKFVDTCGQQCNLHFRGACVISATSIFRNNCGFIDVFY